MSEKTERVQYAVRYLDGEVTTPVDTYGAAEVMLGATQIAATDPKHGEAYKGAHVVTRTITVIRGAWEPVVLDVDPQEALPAKKKRGGKAEQ